VRRARNDQLIGAATTILQGVICDPATVTTAIVGINNAVAHQNLFLI
jgi:nitrogenase molybdenum-iron protein alpha/beta subunit